jgi:hypothetical protein
VQAGPFLLASPHGTERMTWMTRAGAPPSAKANPTPGVMRWRPADCATRATFSVLVSPHGGAFRAARAALRVACWRSRRLLARSSTSAGGASARYLGASSQATPLRSRAGHHGCPVLYQPAASGSDRAITTPAVFPVPVRYVITPGSLLS